MRKTVRPIVSASSRMSSSNFAAPIGSSPAVGSSRNSSAGSSASARASLGALDHPARQLGGIFRAGIGRQADHRDLVRGDLVEQPLVEPRIIFAQGDLDIFGDAQRRKQRPALEHHAPAPAQIARFLFVGDRVERLAIDFDFARGRRLEADDRAHQHRLAGTRSADNAQDLARTDVEIQILVNHGIAELVLQAADANRRFVLFRAAPRRRRRALP